MKGLFRWFNNLTIHRKLVVSQIFAIGSMLLLISMLLVSLELYHSKQSVLRDARAMAHVLGESGSAALVFSDAKEAHALLDNLRFNPDVMQAAFYLPDHQILAAYSRGQDYIATLPPDVFVMIPFHIFDGGQLDVFERIPLPDARTGYIHLCIGLDTLYLRLLEFTVLVALITLGALIVALLLMDRLQRLITQPLSELTQLMQVVSERRDYSHRCHITQHDEIGLLAKGFNTMLEVIQQHESRLRAALTKTERSNRHLDQLARYDSLTGLPNRLYFSEHLQRVVRSTQSLNQQAAFLYIDLDGFKPVNDTLGHGIGDKLLHDIASRLVRCLRSSDKVCRIGGDEFAVLLENLTDSRYASMVAKKIVQSLNEPFPIKGHTIQAGASIGISLYPDDADDAADGEQWMKKADVAMYEVKKRGKGGYLYYSQLHDPSFSDEAN